MKAAIVGLGFGKLHLDALKKNPDIKEIILCDVNQELLKKTSEDYSIKKWTTSFKDVLTDNSINLITLAVPHYLHKEMVQQALEHNKHVYCEKPLTIRLADAVELTRLARERGLGLTVGFNMRYYEQYRKARELLKNGVIGRVFMVECFARANARGLGGFRLSKDKAGGGCLIDSGAHRFDLLRWLIGPVNSVFTRGGNYILGKMEAEDTAIVSMEFSGGIIGTLNCSWGVYAPVWDEGIKIYGEKGTLEIWDSNLSLTWRKADGRTWIFKYNVSYEDTVELSLNSFINSIKEGDIRIDRVKNLANLQIIEAAYQSLEKDLPVKIENPL
jgi:predicted dehydrogenase